MQANAKKKSVFVLHVSPCSYVSGVSMGVRFLVQCACWLGVDLSDCENLSLLWLPTLLGSCVAAGLGGSCASSSHLSFQRRGTFLLQAVCFNPSYVCLQAAGGHLAPCTKLETDFPVQAILHPSRHLFALSPGHVSRFLFTFSDHGTGFWVTVGYESIPNRCVAFFFASQKGCAQEIC